jgi:hypothetical protein
MPTVSGQPAQHVCERCHFLTERTVCPRCGRLDLPLWVPRPADNQVAPVPETPPRLQAGPSAVRCLDRAATGYLVLAGIILLIPVIALQPHPLRDVGMAAGILAMLVDGAAILWAEADRHWAERRERDAGYTSRADRSFELWQLDPDTGEVLRRPGERLARPPRRRASPAWLVAFMVMYSMALGLGGLSLHEYVRERNSEQPIPVTGQCYERNGELQWHVSEGIWEPCHFTKDGRAMRGASRPTEDDLAFGAAVALAVGAILSGLVLATRRRAQSRSTLPTNRLRNQDL